MAKKRPGRPRKSAGQAKSHLMQIRLTPDEKRTFEEAAARTGEALSVWVRGVLRRAAQSDGVTELPGEKEA
jgi:uncharacterized protein (DUF1778 family)